ncbi:MAG TPA: ABC transporter ATP-binding protein [Spirochaetota bacterium]
MIFSLSHINSRYGNTTVLSQIDIEIAQGEFVVLVGPNGAGKSTLLRVMSGDQPVSSGTVLFHNQTLDSYSPKELARLRAVSTAIQGELPDFTVREKLLQRRFSHHSFLELPGEDDHRAAEDALTLCGITHLADRSIRTLSSGELQLVSIAGSLSQNRSTILLDEPASHLDLAHTLTIGRLLGSLHRTGMTLIVVLHEINLALSIASRIIALSKGSLFFDGTPEQFIDRKITDTLYGVTSHRTTTPDGKPYLFFS